MTHRIECSADQDRTAEKLGRAYAEHRGTHGHQAPEAQFQPDREQQQDDAQLRERVDRMGIGDGHVIEPAELVGQPAQAGGTDDHADNDEPDDGGNPEAGEGGNHDAGCAEDDQGVAEARRAEFSLHGCSSALFVTPAKAWLDMSKGGGPAQAGMTLEGRHDVTEWRGPDRRWRRTGRSDGGPPVRQGRL